MVWHPADATGTAGLIAVRGVQTVLGFQR